MYKKCRNYRISTNSTIGVTYIKIWNNLVARLEEEKEKEEEEEEKEKEKK
jgi:hypothetical protein